MSVDVSGLVWGLVGVAPGIEEVVVGDRNEQSDQDGLSDAAVGEPVLRITQVEVVALEAAVQPLRHGPDGGVRPPPRGAEVRQVLAEFVEVAKIAAVQGDGVLVADLRQLAGLMVGCRGQDAGFCRGVGGSLPSVGQVDGSGSAGPAMVKAVEAGAGDRRGGARCWALQADGAVSVRALFEWAFDPADSVWPLVFSGGSGPSGRDRGWCRRGVIAGELAEECYQPAGVEGCLPPRSGTKCHILGPNGNLVVEVALSGQSITCAGSRYPHQTH